MLLELPLDPSCQNVAPEVNGSQIRFQSIGDPRKITVLESRRFIFGKHWPRNFAVKFTSVADSAGDYCITRLGKYDWQDGRDAATGGLDLDAHPFGFTNRRRVQQD